MSCNLPPVNLRSVMKTQQQLIGLYNNNIARSSDMDASRIDATIITHNHGGNNFDIGLSSRLRIEDRDLQHLIASHTSKANYYTALQTYYSKIEDLLGDIECKNNIHQSIQSFFNALNHLANHVENSTLKSCAVNSAVKLSKEISDFTKNINHIMQESYRDTMSDIVQVNSLLKDLFSLNKTIMHPHTDSVDFLDRRDKMINQIAEYIDVDVTEDKSGAVNIRYKNGMELLSTRQYGALNYHPFGGNACQMNAAPHSLTITHHNDKGHFGPQMLENSLATSGKPVTRLGKIAAKRLLCSIMPNIISSIEHLAKNITLKVNAIYTTGITHTSKELKSNMVVNPNDPINFQGSFKIGFLQDNTYYISDNDLLEIDFDQQQHDNAVITLQTTINTINNFFPSQNISISIVDADGNEIQDQNTVGFLSIKSGDGGTIFIKDQGSKEQNTEKSFSHFLGLNNFFEEHSQDSNKDYIIKVVDSLAKDPQTLCTGIPQRSLEDEGYIIGPSSNESIISLSKLCNKIVDFDETDLLSARSAKFDEYFAHIVDAIIADYMTVNSEAEKAENLLHSLKKKYHEIKHIDKEEMMHKIEQLSNNYYITSNALKKAQDLNDKIIATLG